MTDQGARPIPDAFQAFKDQWAFHKAVHEDDWNEGQNYTVKVKQATKFAKFASTVKLGRPTTNEDADVADAPPTTTVKVAAEEKVNLEFSELGGWDVEAKYKNDGSLSYDIKTTALRETEIDHVKDAKITLEGKAAHNKAALPTVGIAYKCSDVDFHAKSNLSTRDSIDIGFLWRKGANTTLGGQTFQAFNF